MDKCENCKFSQPRTPRKTRIEIWEEDPSPVLPWYWWFAPLDLSKYKDPHPYTDYWYGDWVKSMDEETVENNKNLVYCSRYPVWDTVSRSHWCGEYAKDLNDN